MATIRIEGSNPTNVKINQIIVECRVARVARVTSVILLPITFGYELLFFLNNNDHVNCKKMYLNIEGSNPTKGKVNQI